MYPQKSQTRPSNQRNFLKIHILTWFGLGSRYFKISNFITGLCGKFDTEKHNLTRVIAFFTCTRVILKTASTNIYNKSNKNYDIKYRLTRPSIQNSHPNKVTTFKLCEMKQNICTDYS